jgi:hypothetical protein
MLGAAILAREHAAVSVFAGRPKGGR